MLRDPNSNHHYYRTPQEQPPTSGYYGYYPPQQTHQPHIQPDLTVFGGPSPFVDHHYWHNNMYNVNSTGISPEIAQQRAAELSNQHKAPQSREELAAAFNHSLFNFQNIHNPSAHASPVQQHNFQNHNLLYNQHPPTTPSPNSTRNLNSSPYPPMPMSMSLQRAQPEDSKGKIYIHNLLSDRQSLPIFK